MSYLEYYEIKSLKKTVAELESAFRELLVSFTRSVYQLQERLEVVEGKVEALIGDGK